MNEKELRVVLKAHTTWLRNGRTGEGRAILINADLRGAVLCGAALSGAGLRSADLCGTALCSADLSGADLSGADLIGADLIGADLYESDLGRADLRRADLRGAILIKARGILHIGPIGSRDDDLYAVWWPDAPRVKTGCFWGTLDEFAAAVEKMHGSNTHGLAYRAAIEMIRVWAKGVSA